MADAPDGPAPDGGRVAPTDLGGRITALREAAGMTVEEVAARTRIRASLIRGMEAGDFAPCGGAVYARGHLRSIAHVVHADDAELVAAYDAMAGKPSPSAATVVDEPVDQTPTAVPFASVAGTPLPTPVPTSVPAPVQVTGHPESRAATRPPTPVGRPAGGRRDTGPALVLPGGDAALRTRRGSPWVLAAAGVAAAVVVVAGIALATGGSSHHDVTTVAAPKASSAAPSTAPSVPPTPTAPATLADAGVNVTVSIATSSSWVHVVDGTGALVFQGTLTPGTSKAFHSASELKFVFGYAPAVHLVVNGHDVGSPPPNGGSDVADAVFDPSSGG